MTSSKQRHWSLPPAYHVSFEADVPCVLMVWQGYLVSDQFREGNECVLDMVRNTGSTKLLGDITDFTLIGAEDQIWLNTNWIPRLIEAGLRHVALVQPVYYFNKVAVETVAARIDQKRLTVNHFPDRDAARDHLRALV